MADNDLNLLKALTDQTASNAQPGGRWGAAEEAVHNVLVVLRDTDQGGDMWQSIYDAVKTAYSSEPEWGDE